MIKRPCVAVFGGSGKTGGELIAVARRTDLAEFLIDECFMGSYHKQAVYIVN